MFESSSAISSSDLLRILVIVFVIALAAIGLVIMLMMKKDAGKDEWTCYDCGQSFEHQLSDEEVSLAHKTRCPECKSKPKYVTKLGQICESKKSAQQGHK